MNLFRLICALLLTLPLSACALSGGSVEGRVLEEGTDKPIAGAIVVVRWQGYVTSLVDSHGVCVHVDSVVSDSEGRYKLSRWSKPSKVGPVFDLEPAVEVYKVGYGRPRTPSQKDEIVHLVPFKGGSRARLEMLWSIGQECASAGESEKSWIPLRRALYEEAKGLVQSPDDAKTVRAMLYRLEILEIGYDAATKKMYPQN